MSLFHRKKPETDVPLDTAVASSRARGGVPDAAAPDQGSTTGTTQSGEFVGRLAGDDPGEFGESGAERRAEAAREEAQRPREAT